MRWRFSGMKTGFAVLGLGQTDNRFNGPELSRDLNKLFPLAKSGPDNSIIASLFISL